MTRKFFLRFYKTPVGGGEKNNGWAEPLEIFRLWQALLGEGGYSSGRGSRGGNGTELKHPTGLAPVVAKLLIKKVAKKKSGALKVRFYLA